MANSHTLGTCFQPQGCDEPTSRCQTFPRPMWRLFGGRSAWLSPAYLFIFERMGPFHSSGSNRESTIDPDFTGLCSNLVLVFRQGSKLRFDAIGDLRSMGIFAKGQIIGAVSRCRVNSPSAVYTSFVSRQRANRPRGRQRAYAQARRTHLCRLPGKSCGLAHSSPRVSNAPKLGPTSGHRAR